MNDYVCEKDPNCTSWCKTQDWLYCGQPRQYFPKEEFIKIVTGMIEHLEGKKEPCHYAFVKSAIAKKEGFYESVTSFLDKIDQYKKDKKTLEILKGLKNVAINMEVE